MPVGLKRYDTLSESPGGKVPELYAIGDCVQPRKLMSTIWEAYRTARVV